MTAASRSLATAPLRGALRKRLAHLLHHQWGHDPLSRPDIAQPEPRQRPRGFRQRGLGTRETWSETRANSNEAHRGGGKSALSHRTGKPDPQISFSAHRRELPSPSPPFLPRGDVQRGNGDERQRDGDDDARQVLAPAPRHLRGRPQEPGTATKRYRSSRVL